MKEDEIPIYQWIRATVDNPSPMEGEIVLAWLGDKKEPGCMQVRYDKEGWPIYYDLIAVDIMDTSREGKITHWMRIKPPELTEEETKLCKR